VSVGSFALITRCPLCARLAGNFEHDHVALRDAKHAAGICTPMESSNGKRRCAEIRNWSSRGSRSMRTSFGFEIRRFASLNSSLRNSSGGSRFKFSKTLILNLRALSQWPLPLPSSLLPVPS
jgi:hypothetical protein